MDVIHAPASAASRGAMLPTAHVSNDLAPQLSDSRGTSSRDSGQAWRRSKPTGSSRAVVTTCGRGRD